MHFKHLWSWKLISHEISNLFYKMSVSIYRHLCSPCIGTSMYAYIFSRSRIRDWRRVPNNPEDGQVDWKCHHSWQKHHQLHRNVQFKSSLLTLWLFALLQKKNLIYLSTHICTCTHTHIHLSAHECCVCACACVCACVWMCVHTITKNK